MRRVQCCSVLSTKVAFPIYCTPQLSRLLTPGAWETVPSLVTPGHPYLPMPVVSRRFRFFGFPDPVIGSHLAAVGGRYLAFQYPSPGEDLQSAAGPPPHSSRALWNLSGSRELLPAQVPGHSSDRDLTCLGPNQVPSKTGNPHPPACASSPFLGREGPKKSIASIKGVEVP